MSDWLVVLDLVAFTAATAGLGYHYGRKRGLRDAIRIIRRDDG